MTHNDIVSRARSVFEMNDVDPEYVTVQVIYDTSTNVNASGNGVGNGKRSGDVKLELA